MAKKVVINKDTVQLVFKKVENALSTIKTGIKEEKFNKELKRASKHLAKEIFKTVKNASTEKPDSIKPAKKKKVGIKEKAPKSKSVKKEKGVEKPKERKLAKNKKVKVTNIRPENINEEILPEVTI